MSYFLLYLILMLDNIKSSLSSIVPALVVFLVVCSIAFPLGHLAIQDFADDEKKLHKKLNYVIIKILKITIPCTILCLFFSVFLPTTKQMATIYLLPKVVSNKDIQQLPSKTAELLLLEVKKEITSLDVNKISGISDAIIKTKKIKS